MLRSRFDLMFATLLLGIAMLAAGDPAPTPAEEVARQAFVSYSAGDLPGTLAHWLPESEARDAFARNAKNLQAARCLRLEDLRVPKVLTTPNGMTVWIDATTTVWSEMPGGRESHDTHAIEMDLVSSADTWKIAAWRSRTNAFAAQIAGASSREQHRELLAANEDLVSPALGRALNVAATRLVNEARQAAARDVLETIDEIGREHHDLAAMSFAAGIQSVLARHQRDLAQSVHLANESLALAEESGDPDAIGRAWLRLGRAEDSVLPYQRVLALERFIIDRSIVALAATQLAAWRDNNGNHRDAMRYAEIAGRNAEASGEPSALISAQMNLGGLFRLQFDHQLAAFHYEAAHLIAKNAGFSRIAASTLASAAACYDALGDHDRAVTAVEKAITLLPNGITDQHVPELLILRSRLHSKHGDHVLAEADSHEAICRAKAMQDPYFIGKAFETLAEVLAAQGRYREAMQVGSDTWQGQVDAFRGLGDLSAAEAHLRAMLDHRERERKLLVGNVQQLRLFDDQVAREFRHLADLLVEQGHSLESLRIAERLKARTLREILANGRRQVVPTLPDSQRQREAKLNQEIIELNQKLLATRDRGKTEETRAHLTRARMALHTFQAQNYRRQLDESDDIANEAPPDVQMPLHQPAAVVEFIVGEKRTLAITIVGHSPRAVPEIQTTVLSVSREEITRSVKALLRQVQQGDIRYRSAARDLYDTLLRPLEPRIGFSEPLVIVPDGVLWTLPFQVLMPDATSHLVDRRAISYAPSLAVLHEAMRMHKRERNHEGRLLALANPVLRSDSTARVQSLYRDLPTGRLPDAEAEVNAVARFYEKEQSSVYVGAEAREAIVKSNRGRYQVLHIATHGIADDTAPMFSALLLAARAEETDEDGLLEAREIAGLELNADVAVLSACDTARGTITEGEGLIGFSWALLAAGCPTTVLSQWRAESRVTARLMIEFHKHLAAGASAAEALRRAQRKVRRDPLYAHPFYWAPFVVIGAP